MDQNLKKKKIDHSSDLHRINRILGQLEGIKRMIEGQEYCPKILMQTKAVSSALRSVEVSILERHIQGCVKHALKSGKGEQEKLEELLQIFKTRLK